MATVSSHTLNGADGSHAGGIAVRLTNRDSGQTLFETAMDAAGRLSQSVPAGRIDPAATYELVFLTGAYWRGQAATAPGQRVVEEIAVRFSMPDPEARYHVPVILSPSSYCVWVSQPEQGT